MIDTEEKKYVAELCSQTYGFYPRDVRAKQLVIDSVTVVGKFFVLAYSVGKSDVLTFTCNGISTTTEANNDVVGIDGLAYLICDVIKATGYAIITGYEII